MKQEMFTTATVEAAFHNLKEYGAMIPPAMAAAAKAKKAGMILGKFTPLPNCFDGYRIMETPKDIIKMLRKESPNEDSRMFKYLVFVCQGCKNDDELMKGLGIGA
jgi:hypothetical protein